MDILGVSLPELAALVTALASIILQLRKQSADGRQVDVDAMLKSKGLDLQATQTAVTGFQGLCSHLQTQIQELEQQIGDLREQLERERSEKRIMRNQIADMEHTIAVLVRERDELKAQLKAIQDGRCP